MNFRARQIAIILPVLLAFTASANALEICKGGNRAERKVTCLVDGDTGWHSGRKWRIKGADTPEYAANAECSQEVEHAKAATFRAMELLSGGYSITWLGQHTGDRELAMITLPNGSDLGAVLIAEGFAVRWPHPEGVWCR